MNKLGIVLIALSYLVIAGCSTSGGRDNSAELNEQPEKATDAVAVCQSQKVC